jgi:predicted metalloprotease with PDZ domain
MKKNMRKIIVLISITSIIFGCKSINSVTNNPKKEINVAIDLINIVGDKVLVTIIPPPIVSDDVVFHIPKTVPGTYSVDNYGKLIESFNAFDQNNKPLTTTKIDENSWKISGSKKLSKITYLVNDTFDSEKPNEGFGGDNIFSPAGSNISNENIVLNTHCFVGYFDSFMEIPYQLTINHKAQLWGATSMTDIDSSEIKDVFYTNRYATLVENPIMYSKPNYTTFNVNGMDILIAVYSPNNTITAESITPEMKKVMTAQKNFLGDFNSTKKYSVLIYLTDVKKDDAKGFGALEHPTATTVVMPEIMGVEQLSEQLKDVVSHEFFHIVTPLTIHSNEIQNFDYNNPKMSQHLWMYEGVTEYFANLFQINQGLISEEDFYKRLAGKIDHASTLNDTMPFTTMSENVLNKPYKDQYLNVYEKGALIGMCLDILIREKSNGKVGILDLMNKLSNQYGINKAFNDNELFDKITQLTYTEVGDFLKTHVSGATPINYENYFNKVGVTKIKTKKAEIPFLKDQQPLMTINPETKEIIVLEGIELNEFMNNLGIKGGDIFKSFNGKVYNADSIYDLITDCEKWKENDYIEIVIMRNKIEKKLKGKIKLNYQDANDFQATDLSKKILRDSWLKG